jgi:hypothetical protein
MESIRIKVFQVVSYKLLIISNQDFLTEDRIFPGHNNPMRIASPAAGGQDGIPSLVYYLLSEGRVSPGCNNLLQSTSLAAKG